MFIARCMVCGRTLAERWWACILCSQKYSLGVTTVCAWPAWARSLKRTEEHRRRSERKRQEVGVVLLSSVVDKGGEISDGGLLLLPATSERLVAEGWLRECPYADPKLNATYRKSVNFGRTTQKVVYVSEYVGHPSTCNPEDGRLWGEQDWKLNAKRSAEAVRDVLEFVHQREKKL